MPDPSDSRRVRLGFHALLALLICMLVLRPLLGDSPLGALLARIVLVGVPLGAVVTVLRRTRSRLLGAILAVAGAIFVLPGGELQSSYGYPILLLAYLFSVYVVLRRVLSHRRVTSETVSGALVAYLLLGFTWAIAYLLVWQHDPASFAGLGPSENDVRWEAFYFSFVTLTTLGYGDIQPVAESAQGLAMAEAICGQLYLVTMVARLVGLQISDETARA